MMTWWQQLVAFCLSLTAVFIAAGLVGRWGRRMFNTNRKFNRLLDQLLGDQTAVPPIPSLMDQLGEIRDEQDRQAAWQAEHSLLHGIPVPAPRNGNGAGTGITARHRRAS